MGIIIRQSIKSTIVSLVGALIGIISIIYIYPLNKTISGFANHIYSSATLLTPFLALGTSSAVTKFFFVHKKDNEKTPKSLVLYFLLSILLYSSVFLIFYVLFNNYFYNFLASLGMDVSIFKDNELAILSLSFILIVYSLFTTLSGIYGNITITSILSNLGYKLFLPICVVLIYYKILNQSSLSLLIILFFLCITIVLGIYLIPQSAFSSNISRLKEMYSYRKEMFTYSLMNGLTALGSVLAFKIDTIMVSGLISYDDSGKYLIPLTMASMMDIPYNAINGISSPIISKSIEENNIQEVKSIYQKSSINLLIIGILILCGGIACFDNLASLSPNPSAFQNMKWVFIVICSGKLFDLGTSVNTSIISFSQYYKTNLYFVLALGLINIVLNLLFIPEYGVLGSAIATCISLLLFNSAKLVFIFNKFNISPFSVNTIKVLALSIMFLPISYYLPDLNAHTIINIAYKSSCIIVLYTLIIYKLQISIDINQIIDRYRHNVNSILK